MNKESRDSIERFIGNAYDSDIIPRLEEYIRIPNQSPSFDKEWESNGLLDQAMDLLYAWVQKQNIPGMTAKKLTEKGATPFLLINIPSNHETDRSILMYGHMDKQPPLLPWAEGLGPYTPVIRDGKLYGRGGADDGYAVFAAISSIQSLQLAGVKHANISIIIEACEESGSFDLPKWIEIVKPQLGTPDLIICLDSGALNYEQLWLTSSLRGVLNFALNVSLLEEGIHSGIGGGIVPCTFRIVRQLLSRIEDEKTGEILIPELHCTIPQQVVEQMQSINELGPDIMTKDLPFKKGAFAFSGTSADLAIANSWKPCLAVTGVQGLPPLERAGNVLRTSTSVAVSIRLPPTVNPEEALAVIKATLERDPPHGAHVQVSSPIHGVGWAAPPMQPWLVEAVSAASNSFFSKNFGLTGLGGSIPFMGMLGKLFPQAQFVITGVLGPQSNAHGPNEFLHIDYTKRITCCVAHIVSSHFENCCSK